MSLQEIIVIAIVFFCVNYVGIRLLKYFRSIKNNDNPCTNCSGCDLRRMMDQKKQDCKENGKEKNKNSCCK